MNGLRVGLASVALLIAAGCGGGGDEPAEAKTFEASGAIKLLATGAYAIGDTCTGSDGYDDITGGATVVVTDADGKKVALGALDVGQPGEYQTCSFPFAVKDVPSGNGPYSIEVSHRGEVPFSENDASSIALSLN